MDVTSLFADMIAVSGFKEDNEGLLAKVAELSEDMEEVKSHANYLV